MKHITSHTKTDQTLFVLFMLIYSTIINGHTFSTFTTGSITGGGSAFTKSLDVSGLTADYLFYVVSADFVGGANSAYSEAIKMELNNGGSTVYKTSSKATTGAFSNDNNTILVWSGVMNETYSGGGNLTIEILDSFTDGSGPYTSTLNNVTVTIYVEPSLTPVPVELTRFDAVISDGNIQLSWKTATEVNNYGFEIERASNLRGLTEGFITIGFVEGHGNSNSPKFYEFIDTNPPSDSTEYRLKQIDTDGAFTYYAKTVKVGKNITSADNEALPKEFKLAQNYPNPFNPSTTINYGLKSESNVQLIVYDMLGQKVITLVNQHQNAGNYTVQFDASNLSSGTYIYRITAGEFASVKKLVLIK